MKRKMAYLRGWNIDTNEVAAHRLVSKHQMQIIFASGQRITINCKAEDLEDFNVEMEHFCEMFNEHSK